MLPRLSNLLSAAAAAAPPSYPLPPDLTARITSRRHAVRVLRTYAKRTVMYAAALRYLATYPKRRPR